MIAQQSATGVGGLAGEGETRKRERQRERVLEYFRGEMKDGLEVRMAEEGMCNKKSDRDAG